MEINAKNALLGSGLSFFTGMMYFYRQKNTAGFKASIEILVLHAAQFAWGAYCLPEHLHPWGPPALDSMQALEQHASTKKWPEPWPRMTCQCRCAMR